MGNSTQSNLFFNFWSVIKSTDFFLYIAIGGRGIGKTYSVLKGLIEENETFIYVRRTDKELETSCNEYLNPFEKLNQDLGVNYHLKALKDTFLIMNDEDVKGSAGALSTFGKYRGADFSNINYIVFDEFISTSPIDHLKKHEGDLFFNMIETVQRNRELVGGKSVKIICLANSNKLDSGILRHLKLAEIIRNMKVNKIDKYVDFERGLYLALPDNLPISKEKKKTKLYRLTKGCDYYDMAINNDFVGENFKDVKKLKQNQLYPIVTFKNMTFYQIKGQSILYVNTRKQKCPTYNENTKKAFMREYYMYIKLFIDGGKIIYENYDIKLDVLSL